MIGLISIKYEPLAFSCDSCARIVLVSASTRGCRVHSIFHSSLRRSLGNHGNGDGKATRADRSNAHIHFRTRRPRRRQCLATLESERVSDIGESRIRLGLNRRCSSAQSSSVYPSLSRRDAPAGARTRTSGGEWCSHARSVAGVRATRLDAIPQRRLCQAELSASKKRGNDTRTLCIHTENIICKRKAGVSPSRPTICDDKCLSKV